MSIKRITGCKAAAVLLSIVSMLMVCTINVFAAELSAAATAPRLTIDKYEVTNEKIVPGEDFTLTITLTNHNRNATAKDVLVDISNPNGVAPVYGTVSQIFLGDVGPGETREISVDYNSWTTIVTDTLDFNVTVVNSVNQNYIVLRIPAGSDTPFSILSVNAQEEVLLNEMLPLTVAFKVLGDENVREVVLTAYHDGEKIAESQIGILTAGVTKTQQLSILMSEAGEYPVDLTIEYADTAGQKMQVELGTVIVSVVEESDDLQEQEPVQNPIDGDAESQTNDILYLGLGGILILGIFLIIIILRRRR